MLLGFALFPELGQRVGLADSVGTELKLGLRAWTPELFRAFHPAVELLDRRFDDRGRDR